MRGETARRQTRLQPLKDFLQLGGFGSLVPEARVDAEHRSYAVLLDKGEVFQFQLVAIEIELAGQERDTQSLGGSLAKPVLGPHTPSPDDRSQAAEQLRQRVRDAGCCVPTTGNPG